MYNIRYIRLSVLSSLLLLVIMMTVSCSSLPHKRRYAYSGKVEAIADYREFLSELSSMSSASKEDLAEVLSQWREMRDSVFSYVVRDSVMRVHSASKREFFMVDDSISAQMITLAESSRRSLSDVLYIKEHVSPLVGDKDIAVSRDRASAFFCSLDSIGLMSRVSKQVIIRDYRRLLQRTCLTGFSSRKEFLSFLRSEDLYFRMFLLHLSEYKDESVGDITKCTEKVCEVVRNSPNLDSETKVVFMAMRTNRRLIQNMEACIDDIKHLRCRTPELSNAYYCMIVQPYISLDDVSVALLTPAQSKALYASAEEIVPDLARTKINKEMLDLLEEKFPQQLLKVYISTINN